MTLTRFVSLHRVVGVVAEAVEVAAEEQLEDRAVVARQQAAPFRRAQRTSSVKSRTGKMMRWRWIRQRRFGTTSEETRTTTGRSMESASSTTRTTIDTRTATMTMARKMAMQTLLNLQLLAVEEVVDEVADVDEGGVEAGEEVVAGGEAEQRA